MPKRQKAGASPDGGSLDEQQLEDALFEGQGPDIISEAVQLPQEQQHSSAAASINSGKRKRTKRRSDSSSSRETRLPAPPPPPPPPPESLIQLLKSDASVLQYFTSLQSNLEQDVRAWKTKAERYKKEAASLRRQLSANKSAAAHAPVGTRGGHDSSRSRSKSSSAPSKRNETSAAKRRGLGRRNAGKGTANGDVFTLDEDIDNFGDIKEERNKHLAKTTRKSIKESNGNIREHKILENGDEILDEVFDDNLSLSSSSHDAGIETSAEGCKQDRAAILSKLMEAYDCLERLGVSLVDTVEVECARSDGDTNKEDGVSAKLLDPAVLQTGQELAKEPNSFLGYGGDISPVRGNDSMEPRQTSSGDQTKFACIRRSDVDVAADIMRSLRSLVRSASLVEDSNLARQYGPFTSDGRYLPCCHPDHVQNQLDNQEVHPATTGFDLVLKALSVMYTYCGPLLIGGISWDDLFLPDVATGRNDDGKSRAPSVIECIKRGMQGRSSLSDSILLSIDGEITNKWALEDRSARLGAEPLCFDEAINNDDIGLEERGADLDKHPLPSAKQMFGPKSFNRLALLSDRVMYSRLASALYQQRLEHEEAARLVIEYIIASTPSLEIEDHPKYPPVLSACVLEALLHQNTNADPSGDHWFSVFLSSVESSFAPSTEEVKQGERPLLARALALCVSAAAKIWMERSSSADERIRDIANVEFAAYKRVLKTQCSWLDDRQNYLFAAMKIPPLAKGIVTESVSELLKTATRATLVARALSLQLSLTLVGDIRLVLSTSDRAVERLKSDWIHQDYNTAAGAILRVCCNVFKAVQSNWLQSISMAGGTNRAVLPDVVGQLSALDEALGCLKRNEADYQAQQAQWQLASLIAQCSLVLADGHAIDRVARWASTTIANTNGVDESPANKGNSHSPVISKALSAIVDACSLPTVRVINLQRRQDRWISMIDQARRAQVLVVRGLACIEKKHIEENLSLPCGDDDMYWGKYAFDGKGSMLEFERRVTRCITESDGGGSLSEYVATHWHPTELVAFDKDAKRDETAVASSPSEIACALSHISSWMGVRRSLYGSFSPQTERDEQSLSHLHRIFRISGFAAGPSLFHENETMPPAPVCVILEDDSVLVDRFADKLASLLRELPRDFHYCSLGYGRPRNAPIFEYSANIGIPSFLWYCTGYILSQEGSKKLLNDLPVVGPVDTWIGLKMRSNWDNAFGDALGVGRDPRKSKLVSPSCPSSSHRLPTKKDLVKIMKFRVFAARVPLCSQKVGRGLYSSSNSLAQHHRGSWRDRDTDITYSGM